MPDARPPDAVVLMPAGPHTEESLEEIVARKQDEERRAGRTFWGYGAAIHPLTALQPFCERQERAGRTVKVLMPITPKKQEGRLIWRTRYTSDGRVWDDMPKGIEVTSSAWALVIRGLEWCDLTIDQADYVVVGPDGARHRLDEYAGGRWRWRPGKVLALLDPPGEPRPAAPLRIGLVAELVEPYGVLLEGSADGPRSVH